MLRKYELKDHNFDEIDLWDPILHNITWEIRITYHTTTQVSPDQLAFGIDVFFNITYTPDSDGIEERKQSLINRSN